MYKKFDEYMADFIDEDCSQDFWYDVAAETASEILEDFEPNDWKKFMKHLNEKPLEYKRKLAYCLDDNSNIYQLNILLSMIDTDDEALFEACVDSLRAFVNAENIAMILKDELIVKQIKEKLNAVSLPAQKVFKDLLNKIELYS